MPALNSQAIEVALRGDWKTAIALNRELLITNPQNSDAQNRLAYALSKTGQYEEAIGLYEQALEADHYNPIAQKNLSKLKHLVNHKSIPSNSAPQQQTTQVPISPSCFITDAQRTKIVKLINPASRHDLQCVCIGEQVNAIKRRFELQVKSSSGTHLGTFPDDIGHSLMRVIQEKKQPVYIVIKDIQDKEITVFVKY